MLRLEFWHLWQVPLMQQDFLMDLLLLTLLMMLAICLQLLPM
jgi:hypothetical protein